MNETINNYIDTTSSIYSSCYGTFMLVLMVIMFACALTLIAIHCLDPIYVVKNKIISALQGIAGCVSGIAAICCPFFVVFAVSSCSAANSPKTLSTQKDELLSSISSAYVIQVCDTEENFNNLKDMIDLQKQNNKLSSNYQNGLQVCSLSSSTNSATYNVFLVKQNDEWRLCKRNEQGEYIPLNPEHTIQDLKEN